MNNKQVAQSLLKIAKELTADQSREAIKISPDVVKAFKSYSISDILRQLNLLMLRSTTVNPNVGPDNMDTIYDLLRNTSKKIDTLIGDRPVTSSIESREKRRSRHSKLITAVRLNRVKDTKNTHFTIVTEIIIKGERDASSIATTARDLYRHAESTIRFVAKLTGDEDAHVNGPEATVRADGDNIIISVESTAYWGYKEGDDRDRLIMQIEKR